MAARSGLGYRTREGLRDEVESPRGRRRRRVSSRALADDVGRRRSMVRPDFYTAFEKSHGAVFVWSMYLAFGPDGYIRYGLDDPLLALASRTVSMNEQLHHPALGE